jgi:glycyl-tRNA synthetase beta subunit
VNPAENAANIQRGNDRVMRARLADAQFFYGEDLKLPLAARRAKLDGIVFQKRLGTMLAKAERVERLARELGLLAMLPEPTIMAAASGAHLAKCDLVSLMVGELPELQGEMGRAYALAQGVSPDVADVILQHYQPKGASDTVAPSDAGALVAMADRLDTLAGCFAIGLTPTGAADPYSLRRACLGVLRTLLDRGIDLRLSDAFRHAYDGFTAPGRGGAPNPVVNDGAPGRASAPSAPNPVVNDGAPGRASAPSAPNPVVNDGAPGRASAPSAPNPVKLDLSRDELGTKLGDFFAERLKGLLADKLPTDAVLACLAVAADRPLDARARAQAVVQLDAATRARVGEVFKRATNIAGGAPAGAPEPPPVGAHPSEVAVYDAFLGMKGRLAELTRAGKYSDAFAEVAAFAPLLHQYFLDVFVMTDDLAVRDGRLRLMRSISETCATLARFDLLGEA